MRHARWLASLLLGAGLAGCAGLPPVVDAPPPALMGQVEAVAARQVAATPAEVANGATVSLIDPASGNTLATTLSTPTGKFLLNFSGTTFAPGALPYILEATKGLGASNQPGSAAVRLRTLIQLQNGSWESLSAGGLYLGRSSTALCILSSLKGLSTPQNEALMKTLAIGRASSLDGITSPDTFAGTPAVTTLEYQRVWDLVYRALDQNTDPVAAMLLRASATASTATDLASGYGMRDGFAWAPAGIVVSDVNPAAGAVGSTLTVHGHGLSTGLAIRLNALSCPVLTANGTTATFRLPVGATSGLLEVRYGPWINRSLFVTVL